MLPASPELARRGRGAAGSALLLALLLLLSAPYGSSAAPAAGGPAFELRGSELCVVFPGGLPGATVLLFPSDASLLTKPALTAPVFPPPVFVFTLENAVARLRLLAPRVGGDGAAARFCADAAPSGAPVGTYDVVGELLRPSALNQSTRYVVGPHSLSPPPPAPGAGRVGVDDASQTLPPVCGGAAALEPGYWARLATGLLPAAGGGGGSAWVSHADWVSPCHRGVPAADAVARLAARLRRSPAWVQLVGDSVTRALLCDLCTLLHPGSVLRKGDEETCGDDAAALQIWDMGHNPRARHGRSDGVRRAHGGPRARLARHFPVAAPVQPIAAGGRGRPGAAGPLAGGRQRAGPHRRRRVAKSEVAASTFSTFRALRRGRPDLSGRPTSASLFAPFPPDARSDVLVVSGGYHFASVPVDMYGEMVDTMCRSAVANAPARPRGSLLLALNVAANTSLVPTQYGGDVALRSMPYEVARNGAALAAARRSGAAAVDLFSPLLGVQEWAHRDAVHLNAPAGLHAARALARALLHALEAPGGG